MNGPEFSRNLFVVLGIPLDALNMDGAIAAIDAAVAARQTFLISTPNMNFFTIARKSETFRRSLFASDLCLADGAPVVMLAALMGAPITARVAGSDLFETLRARQPRAGASPLKVFLFGGPEGAAEAASARLNATSPGVKCVGYLYPGFRGVEEMSDEATIASINRSGADFLVVALGAVKGQAWLMRNHQRLTVPVRAHLGAVINFEAGMVARAPRVFRKLGLEWLWRIKEEPRLAARYCHDAATLLSLMLFGVVPHFFAAKSTGHFSVAIETTTDGIRLALTGDASLHDIDTIRKSFGDACAARKPVILACAELRSLDAAVLGQIVILQQALARRGFSLAATDLQSAPRKTLQANGLAAIIAN